MLKKILPITIVLLLVGVIIVQAVDRDHAKKENLEPIVKVKENENETPIASNDDLESLYNSVMSSQLEEEPEDIPSGLEIGSKAPDFQIKTLYGKNIGPSDYRGKKVLINFFATWCQPCKAEMPILQHYYENHKANVEILAINVDTKSDVKGFIKKLGVTFPVLLDVNDEVNTLYQIQPIPTSYLLDENGIIVSKHIGSLTDKGLNAMFNNLK